MRKRVKAIAVLSVCIASTALVTWLARPANDAALLSPTADAANAIPDIPAIANSTTGSTDPATASMGMRTSASGAADRPIPEGATWIEVVVVDEASDAPVPGADVAWDDGSLWKQMNPLPQDERTLYQFDDEAKAHAFGWRGRTDAHGSVRVHVLPGNTTLVHARAEARYGALNVRAGSPPPHGWRLELRADSMLEVQVLDAAGAAVNGIPLEVVCRDESGDWIRWRRGVLTAAPEGIARFPHLQTWPLLPGPPRVRLGVPGATEVGCDFEAANPPRDPIVLRLPPTGSILARVVHEGRSVPLEFPMRLSAPGKQQDVSWARDVEADGFAHFRWVPLNARFDVSTRLGVELREEVLGPSAPEQEVRTDLHPYGDQFVVVGRALGPDDRSLAGVDLQVSFSAGDLNSGGLVATDTDGRFRLFLGRRKNAMAGIERMLFELAIGGELCRALVPPRQLHDGTNDIGEVRLAPAPVVAAGRFAFVDAPSSPPTQCVVSRLVHGRGEGANEEWKPVPTLCTVTGDTFRILGDVEPGRYRAQFHSFEHLRIDPVLFDAGASDVVVHVTTGAALTATALLPPPGEVGISFALRTDEPRAPSSPGERDHLAATYQALTADRWLLRWPAVPPGRYTLEARLFAFAEPVLAIPDVAVPGPADGDPRLRDIDLRERLSTVTLTFDESVGSKARIVAFPLPQPETGPWTGQRRHGDTLRLLTPNRPIDLVVACENRVPRELHGVRGTAPVTFDPWPEVQIRLRNLPALADGCSLEVILIGDQSNDDCNTQDGTEPRSRLFEPIGPQGTVVDASVSLPIGNGVRRLLLRIRAPDSKVQTLPLSPPIEVHAGTGVLEVTLPDATLQALARFAK